jgi:hypothetical protein
MFVAASERLPLALDAVGSKRVAMRREPRVTCEMTACGMKGQNEMTAGGRKAFAGGPWQEGLRQERKRN